MLGSRDAGMSKSHPGSEWDGRDIKLNSVCYSVVGTPLDTGTKYLLLGMMGAEWHIYIYISMEGWKVGKKERGRREERKERWGGRKEGRERERKKGKGKERHF